MTFADTASRLSIQAHARFYKAMGGRFAGKRLLLLTTTGRRSGKQRVIPLMRIEDGHDYVVAASMGGAPSHPGWYHNLMDNPRVMVQVGRTVENRTARITEGSERERLWAKFVEADKRFADYASKTDRVIPVVVLEPNESS
ncbi:MAG: nitroreductase family deazaflavin-dependent oxidoreductase [Acidimicrobiia bacterium]